MGDEKFIGEKHCRLWGHFARETEQRAVTVLSKFPDTPFPYGQMVAAAPVL